MSHDEHAKWHWQEGNKYALEGIKTLLLLNGGSAIAVLTFFANWKGAAAAPNVSVGTAVACFGLGALFAVLSFVGAYVTQLEYGNRSTKAQKAHFVTYLLVAASVLSFSFGLWFGWRSLP